MTPFIIGLAAIGIIAAIWFGYPAEAMRAMAGDVPGGKSTTLITGAHAAIRGWTGAPAQGSHTDPGEPGLRLARGCPESAREPDLAAVRLQRAAPAPQRYLVPVARLGIAWGFAWMLLSWWGARRLPIAVAIGAAVLFVTPRVRPSLALELAWAVALQTSIVVATVNGLRGNWNVRHAATVPRSSHAE